MELTREYIENLKVGQELDYLVNKYVFDDELPCWHYSTDIVQAKRIIDKYEDILINFLTPMTSHCYGWHCHVRGIHSRACDTFEEAICKASILYNTPDLWTDSEKLQNERRENVENMTDEDINRIYDIVQKLENERLYTKAEIKKLMRCNL